MAESSALTAMLKRDRLVVVTALVTVIVAAWLYILAGAGMGMSALEMTAMTSAPTGMAQPGGDMPGMAMGEGASGAMQDMAIAAMATMTWTPGYAVLMFFMWWIMMMAMMLPSAMLGAGLLIAAGIYQLTPLKHACLRHCRSPIFFISHHWRPGGLGALRMGVEHGAFCTGCCWFLMALLFYGGVMNLFWIIGLAAFVLLEKTIPAGHWLGRLTGGLLIAWGGV